MLWRRHSDAVNQALLARWLPSSGVSCLLKTDLFDEATTGGLSASLGANLVVGADLCHAIAREARARCPEVRAVVADVRALPFVPGCFDVAVSLSTLDHFRTEEELTSSLREIRRVLRSGGTLILTLDNAANPLVALRNALPFRLLHRLGLVPYYVGVTCGPKRLEQLVEQAGFVVVDTAAVLHCVRVLAVPLCRLVHRHFGEPTQRRLLRLLMSAERLAGASFRFRTGHYVVVVARAG